MSVPKSTFKFCDKIKSVVFTPIEHKLGDWRYYAFYQPELCIYTIHRIRIIGIIEGLYGDKQYRIEGAKINEYVEDFQLFDNEKACIDYATFYLKDKISRASQCLDVLNNKLEELEYVVDIGYMDNTITIPKELISLKECIVNSATMLDMGEGWDGDDAKPISIDLLHNTICFLLIYAKEVFDRTGRVIDSPYIDPLPSGRIDLLWENEDRHLLLTVSYDTENYKNYETIISFYGDTKDKSNYIKNKFIYHIDSINEELALWMKNLVR